MNIFSKSQRFNIHIALVNKAFVSQPQLKGCNTLCVKYTFPFIYVIWFKRTKTYAPTTMTDAAKASCQALRTRTGNAMSKSKMLTSLQGRESSTFLSHFFSWTWQYHEQDSMRESVRRNPTEDWSNIFIWVWWKKKVSLRQMKEDHLLLWRGGARCLSVWRLPIRECFDGWMGHGEKTDLTPRLRHWHCRFCT